MVTTTDPMDMGGATQGDVALASTRSYVMRGAGADRSLETYHLIVAPTHACNLRCKHCYLTDHRATLLPKELVTALVDEWSEITVRERGRYRGIFHLKGGEPFVVPYLGDLAEHLIQLKSLWFMLTTNGTHAGPEDLDLLMRAQDGLDGHLTVVVSLDGATSATHDYLRGPGQFERTLQFIRSLSESAIQVYLNCVLHKHNLDEVPHYVALAKELNVCQVSFLPLVPRGYGRTLRSHQASHLHVYRLLERIYNAGDPATRSLFAGSLPDILRAAREAGLEPSSECVVAYRGLLYVKPDGSAFACPNLDLATFRVGNVYSDALETLLNRLAPLYQSLRRGGGSDTCVCTGERLRYREAGDDPNLGSLIQLQSGLLGEAGATQASAACSSLDRFSYCVSRNW